MLDWLDGELQRLREAGLFRDRKVVRQFAGGWCEWNGRRLKNFAGNDYLDLAHDPRVIEAAHLAAIEGGAGSSASQLVCGRGPEHVALEAEICDWLKGEACLLFPTGYAANLGAISGLAGKEDIIFSDSLNHASLIDGCRLSGAKVVVFPHRELDALETLMHKHAGRRQFVVSDTLFSMDGDVADVVGLQRVVKQMGGTLILDEAHALGTLGDTGGGLAEATGLDCEGVVRIGTLSKALGSLGGFVVGSQKLIDWLWNRARSQIFSTILPPSACAAARSAIQIVRSEPERRRRVNEHSRTLIEGLRRAGFEIPADENSPVVPVILHDPFLAVGVGKELAERGFLVGAIRPPSVPAGTSRLRIALSSGHSTEEVLGILKAIEEIVGRLRGSSEK
ncbi:MAG: 8-amino-7-oxononanoate synthase [Planctomycetaceae bacterium]|nr:8-amino-7-oxononanoate synthase [Planctomycetaceae bacterium]